MFIHNFKYNFKVLFRNKPLVFWTFAFPIILGTLFYMAFSNISESEQLSVIDIAVIDNEEYNNNIYYKSTITILSDESEDDRIFNTKYVNEDEADNLLEDKKIVGYLKLENGKPKLTFNENGINETIFKYVIEEIVQTISIIDDTINLGNDDIDLSTIIKGVKELKTNNIKLNNLSSSNLDYMMIEFYTLIAMTCLYGSMFGMFIINKNMPNMGSVGKRITITPTKKIYIILSGLFASFVVQLIGLIILFLYTFLILKINYGSNILLVIFLSLMGSLAGLSLGVFIGTTFKLNENSKMGMLIATIMLFCFLSGMMGVTMKYVIDTNIPILNKINPANMITDGFYALYYYGTYDRYYMNIISLAIFAVVLISLSFISLRRKRYDSI